MPILGLLQAATPPFPGAGEWASLGGAFVWAIASVLYARSFRKGGPLDAVWFKNAISTVLLAGIAWWIGPARGGGLPPIQEAGWVFTSGLLGMCLGDWLYFVAIAHLGVSRAIILTMFTPALTAFLAWPIHGETLTFLQALGVAAVIGGCILVESRRLRPSGHGQGSEDDDPPGKLSESEGDGAHGKLGSSGRGYLAAAFATLCWTASNLVLREGLAETGAVSGGALRLAAGTAGFAFWFLLKGQLPQQIRRLGSADSWRRFALPTLLGTVVGMSLYVAGFQWAPQGVASSLASTVPIFALPLSVWWLKERLDWRSWTGSLVVVGGVVLVSGLSLS